jgi:benzylsuccinate CoA-transferase BbsF subunit
MTTATSPLPLDGIRIFELGTAIASPFCGKLMAHFGADVLKVESQVSPDVVRLLSSAWLRDRDDLAAVAGDSSPYVPEMNASKRSVGLELKTDSGRDAALRLISECDVFLANFGARALVELGLDYESVSAINPQIIYVQLPGFGTDPEMPYYPYIAWGPNQAPLVGLDDFTGHASDPPAGIATVAPPDYMSALHAAIATLSGLEHREITGEGVHVDVNQFETTLALLGPFFMDYELTGTVHSRIGNRSLWGAPQGVYPCAGHERWIAITATDDESWTALHLMMDLPNDHFNDPEVRMTQQQDLDAQIGAWTVDFDADDLAHRLQKAGVAAHVVSTNEDLLHDTHTMSRNWYQVAPRSRFGRDVFSDCAIKLHETPGRWTDAGPSAGEHTREVLRDVVGMSEAEITQLVTDKCAFEQEEPETVVSRPWEDWIHLLVPGTDDSRDL